MLFICTFNAIFELAPIVGELFGHFVNPAWHIAADCGPEDHALTDMEFMRHHGAPSRMAVSVARPLSLLRARCERPCRRRAAEERDEVASSHVPLAAHSHCFTEPVGRGELRFRL